MENPTSFLFSGLHFNRKKFADDFARFSVKSNETVEKEEEPEPEPEPKPEIAVVSGEKKKRKRKGKTEVTVEGFNVFKTSDSVVDVDEKKKKKKKIEDVITEQKKEVNRQIERDALFRKKYGIHISGHNVPSPLQNFAELSSRYKCEPYLLHNLAELGFKEPTPIQRQAIPVLLSGRECFACAATGSGKTLAFLLPMLVKLKPGSTDGVQAVIICPTRELAAQTTRECRKLAKGKGFFVKLMTKELVTNGDFKKMHCDILVSTPRRLQFAIRKRKLNLTRVVFLVLDESDKLFELGFVKQIDLVVKACSNPSIIRSLFSATLPDSVEELARSIMHDAVRVIIGRKNSASELIKQKLVFTGSEEGKLLAIRQSFAESLSPPVLVFVQSKERAKELYRELAFDDIRVDCIHADLSQTERDDAVDNFRAGKTWVLIATDVISRGMDFKGVNCVINYDFPETASGYIHRIGRTGRAGRAGEAITLFTEDDIPFLRNIANVMTASGCEVPSWIMNLSKLRRRKHRPRRDSISTKPKDEEKEEKEKEREELLKRKRKPRSSKKSIRAKSKGKAKEEKEEKESLPKRMKKPRPTKKSITAKPEDEEVASDKLKKKKKQLPSSDPATTKPKQTKEKASPKLRGKKRSLSEDFSQQSKKLKKVR